LARLDLSDATPLRIPTEKEFFPLFRSIAVAILEIGQLGIQGSRLLYTSALKLRSQIARDPKLMEVSVSQLSGRDALALWFTYLDQLKSACTINTDVQTMDVLTFATARSFGEKISPTLLNRL